MFQDDLRSMLLLIHCWLYIYHHFQTMASTFQALDQTEGTYAGHHSPILETQSDTDTFLAVVPGFELPQPY